MRMRLVDLKNPNAVLVQVAHQRRGVGARALHMIAVCRLRYCERTRAYAARRTAEGKTKREILRCLKRYIAREVYNTLRADLAELGHSGQPAHATTIICGAGPIGITRRHT